MHLQLTDIKITIKTGLSHKGLDKGDVSGLVVGGGKNIDWEVISDIPVPCHDGGGRGVGQPKMRLNSISQTSEAT